MSKLIDYEGVQKLLRAEGVEWRCFATEVINDIPSGYLASYGVIAELINDRHDLHAQPRHIGWLRRHLYIITDRNTSLPLHRIATKGDVTCKNDSAETTPGALMLRNQEGTLDNPKWWKG